MPMALYSLLEQVDFSGKNIVPVVGHGGSRLGGTDAYLHKTVRAEQQVEKRLAKFLTENGYTK